MNISDKTSVKRCEICGKVYDEYKSRASIILDSDRPDNTNRYSRSSHDHVEYSACVDCYDKILKTITDMVHGDK